MRTRLLGLALSALLAAAPALADPAPEATKVVVARGVLPLPAVFDVPATAPRAVVVLLHGSGPQSMDEDLSAVTEGQAPNPFFRNLAAALNRQGLAVLRYDKRNYALREVASPAVSPPADLGGRLPPSLQAAWTELAADPAGTYVADARAALAVARQRFPGLPVLLLGHSEGTWVALQTAREDGHVAGVALIGYAGAGLETMVVDQLTQRPEDLFRGRDRNGDGVLAASELSPDLQRQMPIVDLDGSGTLSLSEFQAGNLSNMLFRDMVPDAWRRGEGARPRSNDLVRDASFRVLFLQGDWDNQTPAYYARAVEIAERVAWKKGNKRFVYFPEAGHALDPRTSWDDLLYRVTPQATLDAVATQVATFLLP